MVAERVPVSELTQYSVPISFDSALVHGELGAANTTIPPMNHNNSQNVQITALLGDLKSQLSWLQAVMNSQFGSQGPSFKPPAPMPALVGLSPPARTRSSSAGRDRVSSEDSDPGRPAPSHRRSPVPPPLEMSSDPATAKVHTGGMKLWVPVRQGSAISESELSPSPRIDLKSPGGAAFSQGAAIELSKKGSSPAPQAYQLPFPSWAAGSSPWWAPRQGADDSGSEVISPAPSIATHSLAKGPRVRSRRASVASPSPSPADVAPRHSEWPEAKAASPKPNAHSAQSFSELQAAATAILNSGGDRSHRSQSNSRCTTTAESTPWECRSPEASSPPLGATLESPRPAAAQHPAAHFALTGAAERSEAAFPRPVRNFEAVEAPSPRVTSLGRSHRARVDPEGAAQHKIARRRAAVELASPRAPRAPRSESSPLYSSIGVSSMLGNGRPLNHQADQFAMAATSASSDTKVPYTGESGSSQPDSKPASPRSAHPASPGEESAGVATPQSRSFPKHLAWSKTGDREESSRRSNRRDPKAASTVGARTPRSADTSFVVAGRRLLKYTHGGRGASHGRVVRVTLNGTLYWGVKEGVLKEVTAGKGNSALKDPSDVCLCVRVHPLRSHREKVLVFVAPSVEERDTWVAGLENILGSTWKTSWGRQEEQESDGRSSRARD
eukprot:CAMPEP_0114544202 /NCGR_PEP_ID=MMETSP0114-20121206/2752_1 /TAXON_ID=31324 /ORGANISM="Goniomonas sp, Strain m" /LENGTH=669 /DNA_ID=CAMNT_0001728569 /DNA_START=292 /DNA_END=2301 /DNA_ORIENTATION=+